MARLGVQWSSRDCCDAEDRSCWLKPKSYHCIKYGGTYEVSGCCLHNCLFHECTQPSMPLAWYSYKQQCIFHCPACTQADDVPHLLEQHYYSLKSLQQHNYSSYAHSGSPHNVLLFLNTMTYSTWHTVQLFLYGSRFSAWQLDSALGHRACKSDTSLMPVIYL